MAGRLDRGAVPFGTYREHGRRYAVYLTLRISPAQHRGTGETVDHGRIPDDALEVAISGEVWPARQDGGRDRRYRDCVQGGQCVDALRAVGSSRALRIADLWDRWHLNGMRAECAHQRDAVAAVRAAMPDYSQDRARWDALRAIPCPDGYAYGSAWLYEPVPPEVLAELRRAFGLPEDWTVAR